MRPRPAAPRPLGTARVSSAGTRATVAAGGAAADSGAEVVRVLIDGRNVQRALERGSPRGSVPTSSLISRLRAAFSPPTEVELILDGHAGPTPTGRVAPGFSVVFSRGATADHVIGQRVSETFRELGPAGAYSVLVVSDDREIRDEARRNGVRVQGTAWLAGHLAAADGARSPTGSIGQGRPPRAPRER
jgi:hypothetical protein